MPCGKHKTLGSAFFAVLCAAAAITSAAVDEEVIVWFRAGTLELPTPTSAVTIGGLVSCDSTIESILLNRQVDQVRRVVPDFDLADTLFVTPEGLNVKMPDLSRLYVLHAPATECAALIADLSGDARVLFAEENGIAEERFVPNDPKFNLQWAVNDSTEIPGSPNADLKAKAAWDLFQGNASVKLGIMDPHGTVWEDHPDMVGRVSGGVTDPARDHATRMAGIAAATGNNLQGVAGIDWHCGIVTHEFADFAELVDDTYSMVDEGVDVINHSWGQANQDYNKEVATALAIAYKQNALTITSMPATRSPSIFPSAYNWFGLNVAATTKSAIKAPYSIPNSFVDIAAPGGDESGPDRRVLSTTTLPLNDPYGYAPEGTSVAAAHVSGAASLLKGFDPTLYNDDIANLLRYSADDINSDTKPGFDSDLGWGRLNLRGALDLLRAPYSVVHHNSYGGVDYYTYPDEMMTFMVDPNQPCRASRHEVRKTVTYAAEYALVPKVWGRGVETVGWAAADPNYGIGWCEPVGPGSKTGCTLRTYVFELWAIRHSPNTPWLVSMRATGCAVCIFGQRHSGFASPSTHRWYPDNRSGCPLSGCDDCAMAGR